MLAGKKIYLDANAGAPLHPRVREALRDLLATDLFANPSSIHAHGRISKRHIAEAREGVAASFGAGTDPEQVLFTSSGTEANQLIIKTVLEKALRATPSPRWITTPVEHDSVLQMQKWFEAEGGKVDLLPVDRAGGPQGAALSALVRPETALLSTVWVNNETGVISDLSSLNRSLRTAREQIAPRLRWHLDAAQAWGKLGFNAAETGADYLSVSAHKIGGLAGAGAIWMRPGNGIDPVIHGHQEKGRRGGTENLLGIISMGIAARQIQPMVWAETVAPLRARLESAICDAIPQTIVNGQGAPRVANTLNVSFHGVGGDSLVMALDLAGYSVSAGSACASGVVEPSHVLLALGRSRAEAMSAIRVSLSERDTWESLEGFVAATAKAVERVRQRAKSSEVGI
ncbi:MAG: cysteine desulfurase family protein [Bacteriovoracia bacterium]